MKGELRSVFTVGGFTALSRVLGLVREMFQSRLIGAGVAQSAFTIAFAIPNMARKLFGEGALTAAFVPVFKAEVESGSFERAARLARAVMTMTFLMLGALLALAFGATWAVDACRETAADAGRWKLTLGLVRTLLPYMLFICGAAFGMGVLNAMGRFKAAAFMPCLMNLVWIGALAALAFFPGIPPERRIRLVAYAILGAGALQMLFMFRCMAKVGVVPRLSFRDWGDEKVRLVWRNVAVAAVGAGAVQINYMLDQILAQLASGWAAGVIGYAERLMDLPLGVIGVAFGTVLLPTFAGCFARGDVAGARQVLSSSVVNLMFVMLPAAAGLCVLAPEITDVIYEGGDFDAVATARVARALAVYSLGLGFFSFHKSIVPWFQAQNDMKTPLRVSVLTVVANAAMNIAAVVLLPVEWKHVGLAGSTVVSSLLGCAVLVALAHRRNGPLGLGAALKPVSLMVVAAALMAAAVAAVRPWTAGLGRIGSLAACIAVGGVAYMALSLVLFRGRVKGFLRRRA